MDRGTDIEFIAAMLDGDKPIRIDSVAGAGDSYHIMMYTNVPPSKVAVGGVGWYYLGTVHQVRGEWVVNMQSDEWSMDDKQAIADRMGVVSGIKKPSG